MWWSGIPKLLQELKATAWDELYKYYGETLDQGNLDLMDSVLTGVITQAKETEEEKEMTELEGLIRYWESNLQDKYLLSPSVVAIIEGTIKYLKKQQKEKEHENNLGR